ncbi:hypothetical protein CBR_g40216 [Chara braunii]|uniref:DUF659 domain-containing protein n=1 Tax=Chara braunii TaxID=69332 RepID=A0A388K1Q0_CHABU|nr:hypothetical protein CBR_g40216 [Chara braunii]|eukprot:GBG63974.1 hypothetical protein CBR_g40216 [Chara braunii]
MPFNCSKLESFKRMFTMIIPPGVPGAAAPRLPSYHMLRTTLLDELDGEIQKCVRPVLDTSRETGCIIMTDGWTNIRGQTLCNYLVGTEIGVVYVATDVTRGKKDASALANAWLKRVKSMDIQLSDITALVTDSAEVNVAAMEVFQKDESVKHIFWIPCVAHVMHLILEDIGGIDWVASRIAQARLVTRFFKRHGHAREVLEAHSTKTLLLPAETRFITNVIMMERALRKMLEPIMDMLKLVDSNTRQISKILRRYEEMIASCLSACRDIDRDQQDAIVEVFIRRRTMFETPAHTAATLLDPEFRDATLCDDAEVQPALVEALVQFGYSEGSPQHQEVQRAVAKLHTREPPFDELTMRRAADIFDHPASFWSSKKGKFPHTTVFAGRILRIWATTSPCERAWSRWSFIHSKSCNRLEVPRAEKLVRCQWNLRLLDRPSLCDDGVGERPGVFGKWVHYWQAMEDEAAVDQQLVRGTGALARVTEEELSIARERMRAVSRMGAERRVAESDRRRRRAGGRGRGGRGREGVGEWTRGDVGSAPRTRRHRTEGCIRRARVRWDEGDFLFDNTSSDDDDFFASGTHASTGDDRGDADDRSDDRGDGDNRGEEGGGDGGGGGGVGDSAGPGVEERVDDGLMLGGRFVLKRLRHRGRRDESIASRVRRRHVHIAIDTGARVMEQDPVAVSADEMGEPSNETRRDPVHAEAQASNTDLMVTEDDTGFRITHPRSPASVVGTEEETEFGGPSPLRQAQTRCTPAGAAVHSTGEGLEDCEARREPPPHMTDNGLEDGEVAPTPTCGQDGKDECPPTGHHVGLDCPPDSLPCTDELFTMHSALASLPDVSLLISPTLPVVAPPEHAGRDDARRDRGFDEFGSDTILRRHDTTSSRVRHSRHFSCRCTVGDGAGVGGGGGTEPSWRTVHEPRPHLMGMRDIMRPPPSRPLVADPAAHGQAAPSALPTRFFYDGVGMDRKAGDMGQTSACGPADVPAGARSIGNVDGTCHDSMRAYEEQHGTPLRAETTDVHDTRTATARLSWARKKGTGVSIPYHRRRPQPFFRNGDETRQMPAAADGQGGAEEGDIVDESGRGERRRGGTIIIHDDSSTAAESGETTCADDPDDSDYVPRIRTADGDDGGGRRVRMRTWPGRNERGGYGASSDPYPKSRDPRAAKGSTSRGADDRPPTPRNSCIYNRGDDHIKKDCPDLKRAIEEGLVVLDDRKYVKWADDLGDVSMFPLMKEESIKITFEGDMATTPIRVAATKLARGSTSKKAETDYVMAEKDGQRIDGEEVILSPRKRGVKKFLMKSSLDEIDMVEPLWRALRQPMQCSILEYLAASKSVPDELQMITRKTRVPLSEEAQGTPKADAPTVAVTGVTARADRMATVLLDGMEGVPPDKFYILGSGAVETIINDGAVLDAVIDNGSEPVIINEDLAVQVRLGLDRSYLFEIETADGRKQQITGVCHKAAIQVQGVRVTLPVFAVKNCSSDLLLGRTWLSHVHAVTIERSDGSQTLSIKKLDGMREMIETVEPRDPGNRAALAVGAKPSNQIKSLPISVRAVRFREKKYGPLLTEEEGWIVEVEDLGSRLIVDGESYPKEKYEEFGGVVSVSFLRARPPIGGYPSGTSE